MRIKEGIIPNPDCETRKKIKNHKCKRIIQHDFIIKLK
jgi:hypothetical protein